MIDPPDDLIHAIPIILIIVFITGVIWTIRYSPGIEDRKQAREEEEIARRVKILGLRRMFFGNVKIDDANERYPERPSSYTVEFVGLAYEEAQALAQKLGYRPPREAKIHFATWLRTLSGPVIEQLANEWRRDAERNTAIKEEFNRRLRLESPGYAMDILSGLKDKLRFTERHYAAASESFREAVRKIEASEPSFEPPPFDPETDMRPESPFSEEWQEADESLNLVGEAALQLVQCAFRDYLSWFVKLSGGQLTASGKNWLERYKNHFLQEYDIDWESGPVPIEELEEVNLARNDVEHNGQPFAMTRVQSKDHKRRFPRGVFVDEIHKQAMQSNDWPRRIDVTADALKEAIRRIEAFCEFLDSRRLWY